MCNNKTVQKTEWFWLSIQSHSIFKLSESRIIAEDAEDADFRA